MVQWWARVNVSRFIKRVEFFEQRAHTKLLKGDSFPWR
jgi:hypothetical protein